MNPVDRLIEIRSIMKQLRQEHQAIRAAILAGEISQIGETGIARIRNTVRITQVPSRVTVSCHAR